MNHLPGQKADPYADDEDEDGPWRHPPVTPRDASVADSLGKAVSDVVAGPLEGDPAKADRPAPTPPRKP